MYQEALPGRAEPLVAGGFFSPARDEGRSFCGPEALLPLSALSVRGRRSLAPARSAASEGCFLGVALAAGDLARFAGPTRNTSCGGWLLGAGVTGSSRTLEVLVRRGWTFGDRQEM